ncbi:hypothetical protein HKX48_002131 [Thoreauomyces humboldtii]|nr:hypothetical protein HKX48_002131 [Thoreauomyces humboldtii]
MADPWTSRGTTTWLAIALALLLTCFSATAADNVVGAANSTSSSGLVRRDCLPTQVTCGVACIDPDKGEYHCMKAPDGSPLLVQGPGYRAEDPDADVYTAPITNLDTPGWTGLTKQMQIVNKCAYKVWPAIQGAKDAPVPADGGFGLAPGSLANVAIPWNWISGRVWGRTNCKLNNGKVFCETGTCGIPENNYGVACQGNGGIPPYTIAEFTLAGWGNKDYYDLSQVDGHTLDIQIEVIKGTKMNDPQGTPPNFDCGNPSCRMDIQRNCPVELSFKSDDRKRTIACGSIHDAVEDLIQRTYNPNPLMGWFNDESMRELLGCVAPNFGYSKHDVRPEAVGKVCDSVTWPSVQSQGDWPTRYDQVFKDKCPDAYSWQFDDLSSTFNCRDADYRVTFCPSAQCGKDAQGATCPNGQCCSAYGMCGVGQDFCGEGCQSNCNSLSDFPAPGNCATANPQALTRVVAYYSNSAANRGANLPNCKGVLPSLAPDQIRTTGVTHLVYTFGAISPGFTLATTSGQDDAQIKTFNGLKTSNTALKTMWSIGGWAFNTPGSGTETRFSNMVTSPGNRAKLISDILTTVPAKGFDGVDFDWEYPGPDRGGQPTDAANYVQFFKELNQAITSSNSHLLVSVTIPADMSKINDYALKDLQDYVDWMNFKTYDLVITGGGGGGGAAAQTVAVAGGYSDVSPDSWPTANGVQPLTTVDSMNQAIQVFLKAGVRRTKLVMGIAFYGRNYQLASSSCANVGCSFTGPGAPGVCTNTPGFLSYNEIKALSTAAGATETVDSTSNAASVVIGSQWITYETPQTITTKMQIADAQCLSGVSAWSTDLDPSGLLMMAVFGNSNVGSGLGSGSVCNGDGTWPSTKAGALASLPCPFGGDSTRQCGNDGTWGNIDSDNCQDASSQYFQADFDRCKRGIPVDTSMNSLGVGDVGLSTRRKRDDGDDPERLEKRQAGAPAAGAVQDLWTLMASNPAGQDLPTFPAVNAGNEIGDQDVDSYECDMNGVSILSAVGVDMNDVEGLTIFSETDVGDDGGAVPSDTVPTFVDKVSMRAMRNFHTYPKLVRGAFKRGGNPTNFMRTSRRGAASRLRSSLDTASRKT